MSGCRLKFSIVFPGESCLIETRKFIKIFGARNKKALQNFWEKIKIYFVMNGPCRQKRGEFLLLIFKNFA